MVTVEKAGPYLALAESEKKIDTDRLI